MAETTEKTEQDKTIAYLIKTVEQQYKTLGTLWEMVGEVIDYIMVSGDERKDQNIRLIKELYESKLAERHNTRRLNEHFEFHSLSNRKNTYIYNEVENEASDA